MESRGRGSRSNSAGMTLNTMLSDKRGPIRPGEEQFPRAHSNRTLSDIIRDESGGSAHYYTGKKSWRHFKDKLRRRRGSAWTSTFSTPASDISRSMNRRPSGGFPSDMVHQVDISAVPDVDPELMSNTRNRPGLQRNASRAMERASDRPEHTHALGMRRLQREDNSSEDDKDNDEEEECESEEGESGCEEEDEEAEAANAGGQQPVRMSLMSLLAETDREMGLDGSSYILDEDDEDEDDDRDGGEYNNCCVCMVRHKGAAFVPCGHSFCRLCSRELWAQRGNCPLCNNYILEILDIF